MKVENEESKIRLTFSPNDFEKVETLLKEYLTDNQKTYSFFFLKKKRINLILINFFL